MRRQVRARSLSARQGRVIESRPAPGARAASDAPRPAPVAGEPPILVLERAAVLSNGRFVRWLTAAGTGGCRLGAIALTPWRADPIEDTQGCLVYLRDRVDGSFWSLGREPVRGEPDTYQVAWHPGRFEITRRERGIESRLEACVAADAPAEVARITVRNASRRPRTLEITTYAEVLLHEPAAGAAHPAFAKLFVETERVAAAAALVARRRPRHPSERFPILVHSLAGPGPLEHETDRVRWIGRGRSLAEPLAMNGGGGLSGSTGSVLDPIVSLRRIFELEPGELVTFALLFGAGADREEALELARRFLDPSAAGAALEQAELHRRAEIARLELDPVRAEGAEALAVALRYGDGALRSGGGRGAATLEWPGATPGAPDDRPLVLYAVRGRAAAADLPAFLALCRYWGTLGLPADAVVLADDPGALRAGLAGAGLPAGVRVEHVTPGALPAFLARADLVLEDGVPGMVTRGSDETFRSGRRGVAPVAEVSTGSPAAEEPLLFDNGWGGFARGGSEYVIRLRPKGGTLEGPPLPWINVLANPDFGALLSETGAGYTWSRNSQRHRLTPWHNDPLLDPHEEALYLRDEETGECWSPHPGPAPAPAPYEVRHGFGYTQFRHVSHGLEQESLVFVARSDPLKVTRVRIVNRGPRARRLTLVSYQRLVLGTHPGAAARLVATELDPATEALLARNPAAGEFAEGVAFAAAVRPPGVRQVSWTTDRERFLGARGSVAAPVSLRPGHTLEPHAGTGHVPCFALGLALEVPAGAASECTFLFGEARGTRAARELVGRWREPGAVETGLEAVRAFWTGLLGRVRVETPSPEIDLMVNGWLAYQTLASRLWGRTALYQSGGAFGFRDQLQDALALATHDPGLARRQILLHAAHQFPAGDVLHWWHPPGARGIRTRFADDLLWLPYVTAEYVARTGDRAILGQPVPFVVARELAAGEDEAYLEPSSSSEAADLYEHCCRAIERSLACGRHGLPLFGTGDWNDGMNRVGRDGQGESVWMGFFLHAVLGAFRGCCEARGDEARAARYEQHRAGLRIALEGAGWDGAWYRRGYYDDGTPLGSAASDECRIDALVQAWAVISGAVSGQRSRTALDAVERLLVSERDGLIRLLWPPFDRTPQDPGYIKAYLPGVRENGGQYTHAALWVVRALAELGARDRAARLLAMLSPVSHGGTRERAARYRGEPYVVAADVYGVEPHVGRVGWTWYTGSAGWMLRVALETVLGIRFENGRQLVVAPRVPDGWERFRVACAVPGDSTRVEIAVENPHRRAASVVAACLDGREIEVAGGAARVALPRDGATHHLEVELG